MSRARDTQVAAGTTPDNLARIREECGRIFESADSLYPSEIEFAEHVLALVDIAEAARSLARTWFSTGYWGKPHVPDAIALREALQRLGEDRV